MSIQSSINQMLSSVANQQLFKGLTTKVGEIKTDTGNLTEEQKRFNELIKKHGGLKNLTQDAENGKERIEDEIKLRKEYPDIDDTAETVYKGLSNMAQTRFKSVEELRRRITNIAQTRVTMEQLLAEDTQDVVKERYEQSKGCAQK